MERLETRIKKMQEMVPQATVESLLDNDMAFLAELVKPTAADLKFMDRQKQDSNIQKTSLWSSALENFHFRQDLRMPPSFFIITCERSIVLTNTDGTSIRAQPGTMWQQIGIEPVAGEPLCFWV